MLAIAEIPSRVSELWKILDAIKNSTVKKSEKLSALKRNTYLFMNKLTLSLTNNMLLFVHIVFRRVRLYC